MIKILTPEGVRTIEEIFEAKRERRKQLASLPVEEKVKILLQLQKIASPILKSRGLEKEPWKIDPPSHG